MTRKHTVIALVLAAAAAFALPATAATYTAHETDAKGGDFGHNTQQAGYIGANIETVFGVQNRRNDVDLLTFDGFADGTEALDFTFTNPGGDWGGFNLRIKTEPFKNKNDWWPLVFSGTYGNVTDSTPEKISYALEGYTGKLYVAIDFFDADFRNGNGLNYAITKRGFAPAPPQPPLTAPVPVPAALPLGLAGIAALAGLRRLRRRG